VSALPCDPRTVLDQYEALRCEALEAAPFGPRGHGLALFLSRGLPDWLAALTALVPPGAPSRPIAEPPRDGGPRVEPAAREELTTVLAGMVLACTQPTEVTACTAPAR
jgi:hypothetical protein